jgi:hypothetical protein
MCLPTCGILRASKSHAARRWTWVPSRDLTQPALGTLAIVQGKREATSYSVDIEDIGRGSHSVLFVRLDGPEIYSVTVSPAGRPVDCTCSGHGRHGHCKHRDTVGELIAEDILPLMPAETPAPVAAPKSPTAFTGYVPGFLKAEASF